MYATTQMVEAGFRELTPDEEDRCTALLEEAGVLIDATGTTAADNVKALVSCRMVRRALGDSDNTIPLGASQGTISAGGYSQSWTVGANGSTGELYFGRFEKKLLGISNTIGAGNPLGALVPEGLS
jgi:hypothetical protein